MGKTLILAVDRDDDLGRKAKLAGPVIGRKHVLNAGIQMGLADPGDSDTNAILMAVHTYDKEVEAGNVEAVEVALITGHTDVGLRSDRILASQLDEVLMVTKCTEVILVTDGAEDEQILPILQSRTRVVHIARSIVKQAPRIEGFLYVLTRMLDDEKLAKKYLLPIGIITLIWSISFFFDLSRVALGLTLGVFGVWLLTHAFGWQERAGRFFRDFKQGIQTGRFSLVASVVGMAVVAVGAVQSWQVVPVNGSTALQVLTFSENLLPYLMAGILIHLGGKLIEELMVDGRARFVHWTTGFSLISLFFVGGVLLDLGLAVEKGEDITRILSFDMAVRLLVGLAFLLGGITIGRYMRGIFQMQEERSNRPSE